MLRFIGSLALGAVCVMYGSERAAQLMRHRDFLRRFCGALSVIETEISFGRRALGDIFSELDSPELYGLFTDCADALEKSGIRNAWHSAASSAAKMAGLAADEQAELISLGTELGRSDVEGQKNILRRAAAYASARLEAAEDEYRRMGRVYRSCGLLVGALLILILI